ncbi:MAG: hypothetical protein Q8R15_00655 [Candidatus Micrarchaeota archaeon]|nr:hypothetical protein [Candidatus Micrarchaeota archaeon]
MPAHCNNGMVSSSVKRVLLSNSNFNRHPTYRQQVAQLVEAAFERDKLPGESRRNYLRAFLHSRGGHHLLVVREGSDEVIAHYNGIPASNPAGRKSAFIGHLIVKSGTSGGIAIYKPLNEHLAGLGFTEVRGSHYSTAGSRLGAMIRCTVLGVTRRGKQFQKPELTYYKRALR